MLLEVDKFDAGQMVYCIAKQKIVSPNQFEMIRSILIHLLEYKKALHKNELKREILVFEGKIKDVEW